jgi:hypothetical protein
MLSTLVEDKDAPNYIGHVTGQQTPYPMSYLFTRGVVDLPPVGVAERHSSQEKRTGWSSARPRSANSNSSNSRRRMSVARDPQ